MNVTLLGATGATGRLLLDRLLTAHSVRALARRPLAERPGLEVVTGDALDPDVVRKAVTGADVVVTLVADPRGQTVTTTRSAATAILVDACGPARLIVVSALGGTASRDQQSWFGRVIYRRAVGPERLAEVDRQERIITASTLDYTLIRPPRLVDGPAKGYRVLEPGTKAGMSAALTRADLASAIADEVAGAGHVRQAVMN